MSKKNKHKHKKDGAHEGHPAPANAPAHAAHDTGKTSAASSHSRSTPEQVSSKKPTTSREPASMGKIISYAVVGSLLTLLLAANIVYSQIVNPVWERMTNGDRVAQVQFFKIIKDMPVFAELRDLTSGTYATLQQDINADDVTRKDKIAKMEALLDENPDNPDLLYAISTLYRDGGDDAAADDYLQRARELDPLIGR
jgi:hypothetical protein